MRKLLVLALAGFAVAAVPQVASAKAHIQSISKSIAEAFCSGHGGGTSCNFCDRSHCHVVGCDSQGKNCKNAVMNFRAKQGGAVRTGVGTTNRGFGTAGPMGHPVHDASGLNQGASMSPTPAMHHGGGRH